MSITPKNAIIACAIPLFLMNFASNFRHDVIFIA